MLLKATESVLIVIDLQSRLVPAVADHDRVVANAAILMRAARRLDVPVLLTEQYPKGLGRLVPEIARLAPDGATVEKLCFAAPAEQAFRERLEALDRGQVIVVGMEAHVCVLQAALMLVEHGYETCVVADATGSRDPANREAALSRMAANGVEVATTEMVVFEWLQVAGTDAFRELSKLIK